MRYTIGLDIGIASVGWAVINNEQNRIEDLGVRMFKKAEEPDGKSLNLARREARNTRTRLRRKKIRMKKVKELFVKYNLVSKEELENLYLMTNNTKDVWDLREIALNRLITREEWARVLTNIAKRRGYKSNRKVEEEEDKELGKLTSGVKENERILKENNYRTIGEMFFKDAKFKSSKRNKNGSYTNSLLRLMLVDEVKILFEKQRKYSSNFASEEFEKEYIDIITYQKGFITPELLEKMLGKCSFERTEHRAPKNSYTFERFYLLQKVNNLRIFDNGEIIVLDETQRNEIIDLAYKQTEIKYTQLRKKLNLPDNARFIDLNYNIRKKNEEMTQDEIIKQVENQKFLKLEGWHKIKSTLKSMNKQEYFSIIEEKPNLQNIIADALIGNKTDESIRKHLQDKMINDVLIEAACKINFTKVGHLSYKAMEKIIPELEKGLTYDKACMNVGYQINNKEKNLYYKLPKLEDLDIEILNPVVLRAVTQARKVINAIIDKYGSPTEMYIETARELAKPYEERSKIERIQNEKSQDNEKIKRYIKETFNFEPKPFDIVKYRLWQEQHYKCAYSQKPISAENLFVENYAQVDHIIPFSRCFDNSYNNKVLVLSSENQAKKNMTPFEYMGENKEKWHVFEEFVNTTYKNNGKKRQNLLITKFDENKSNDFIERNLNDTRYISKFMYNYISNNLKFADSPSKKKVFNINGAATATLRHQWGLEKNREESDKHHAQDAIIVACATNKNIKKISDYSKQKELYIKNSDNKYMFNDSISLKAPWPKFREEVMARMEDLDNNGELYTLKHGNFKNYEGIDITKIKPIFVSRMPERKITGKAHDDTMRSQKFIKQGYNFTTVKKPLILLSRSEIETIIYNEECSALYLSDKLMYDDIYVKMQEHNFKASQAFADGYRKHSKSGNSPIVRSVTVPSMGSSGVELKNGAIANNSNMIRVDVFKKDNKYYLVPIYVADFARKILPNKAIVANKNEKDWIEMTQEYEFQFSLYPNDLVKVKKKNEPEIITYYRSTHRGTAAINIQKNPNISGEQNLISYGSKTLEIFEKYQVDILGNISKVKKEKRRGIKN